jgi:hypothetical protein
LSAQHTPGPLHVQRIPTDEGVHHLVCAANGCPLAKLEHTAEDRGNAVLFAAAPDLLKALRRALDAGIGGDGKHPSPSEEARAAIAKATGAAS